VAVKEEDDMFNPSSVIDPIIKAITQLLIHVIRIRDILGYYTDNGAPVFSVKFLATQAVSLTSTTITSACSASGVFAHFSGRVQSRIS
jgi:hypothetical protein